MDDQQNHRVQEQSYVRLLAAMPQFEADDFYFHIADGLETYQLAKASHWEDLTRHSKSKILQHFLDAEHEGNAALQEKRSNEAPAVRKPTPRDQLSALRRFVTRSEHVIDRTRNTYSVITSPSPLEKLGRRLEEHGGSYSKPGWDSQYIVALLDMREATDAARHALEQALRPGGLFQYGLFTPPVPDKNTMAYGKKALSATLKLPAEERQTAQDETRQSAGKLAQQLWDFETVLEQEIALAYAGWNHDAPIPDSYHNRLPKTPLYPIFMHDVSYKATALLPTLPTPKDHLTEEQIRQRSDNEISLDRFIDQKDATLIDLALRQAFPGRPIVAEEKKLDTFMALRQQTGFRQGKASDAVYRQQFEKAAATLAEQLKREIQPGGPQQPNGPQPAKEGRGR